MPPSVVCPLGLGRGTERHLTSHLRSLSFHRGGRAAGEGADTGEPRAGLVLLVLSTVVRNRMQNSKSWPGARADTRFSSARDDTDDRLRAPTPHIPAHRRRLLFLQCRTKHEGQKRVSVETAEASW